VGGGGGKREEGDEEGRGRELRGEGRGFTVVP
jgi:hypothetical protein